MAEKNDGEKKLGSRVRAVAFFSYAGEHISMSRPRVLHVCPRCPYSTYKKRDYNRHLTRKSPCEAAEVGSEDTAATVAPAETNCPDIPTMPERAASTAESSFAERLAQEVAERKAWPAFEGPAAALAARLARELAERADPSHLVGTAEPDSYAPDPYNPDPYSGPEMAQSRAARARARAVLARAGACVFVP